MRSMDSDERFAVLSEHVQLAYRTQTLPAFFAAPQTEREEAPAVILAMHLWGVDASMRAAAERFARAGFVTLVPDLYAGLGAPPGDDSNDATAFVPFARRLTTVDIDAAFDAGVRWLHDRYPLAMIGLAGFCMGGRMATARASGNATSFAAVAAWYGLADIDPHVVDVPLVGSYGADDTEKYLRKT
jgi:carboxymethylenebutenolidase